jgi:hypothetical protein
MSHREFANQKQLIAYAERNDLVYAWERSPAFAKRQRLLSPKQYEIVGVRVARHEQGDAVLGSNSAGGMGGQCTPTRAMAIKRERWRVKRAQERRVAERKAKQRST